MPLEIIEFALLSAGTGLTVIISTKLYNKITKNKENDDDK